MNIKKKVRLVLYHEIDVHYDLVLPRPPVVENEWDDLEDIPIDNAPEKPVELETDDDVSIPSMDFQPGVPKRGKPKKNRQGAQTFNNRSQPASLDQTNCTNCDMIPDSAV